MFSGHNGIHHHCKKLGKISVGQIYRLLLGFAIISDFYMSFIPNKTTFTKYCLTQWISKLPGSFEIHWVTQYLVNFMGLAGIVNTNVYKTKPTFTGLEPGKLSLQHWIHMASRFKMRFLKDVIKCHCFFIKAVFITNRWKSLVDRVLAQRVNNAESISMPSCSMTLL